MTTTVEVGFVLNDGSQPLFRLDDTVRGVLNNATYLLGGVSYVDITKYVNNVSFKRGKNRELDRFSAGTLTIQLNNEDRTFDPSYVDSPFYGNIIPRREVRVLVDSVPQFSGVIEDWNFDYDVSGKSKAVIVAADAFTLLAQQSLTAGTATVQTSGARVSAVLNMVSVDWPAANRNIDTGLSTLGADVFSGNVLQYLQDVEVSEQGALFIGKDGFINFQDRGVTPTSSNSWEYYRTNYIKNPNFAVDTTDWAANEATTTISRDPVEFYSSPASLKVVTTLAGGGTYKLNSAVAGLVAGAKFSGSVWVKAAAGTPLRLSIASQGTGAVSANNFFTATGDWQYVKAEGATLGTSLNPYVFILSTASAGVTFYVDNVIMEMTPTIGDYFDGSTNSTFYKNSWQGTANNSISIQEKFIYAFSDNGIDIPYINVGINYGTELLFNQAIISSSAGTAISNNVTSENTYGITQYSANTLVSTTSQLQNISDYVVAKYGMPELRFEIIEIFLEDLTPTQRAKVLSIELGDIAIIAFTPNGIGEEIVQKCQIISIAHNIQVASHKITFGMSWLQFSFLVMDDLEFGRLDSTYVLAF